MFYFSGALLRGIVKEESETEQLMMKARGNRSSKPRKRSRANSPGTSSALLKYIFPVTEKRKKNLQKGIKIISIGRSGSRRCRTAFASQEKRKKVLPGSFNEEADFKGSPLPGDPTGDGKWDDDDELFFGLRIRSMFTKEPPGGAVMAAVAKGEEHGSIPLIHAEDQRVQTYLSG